MRAHGDRTGPCVRAPACPECHESYCGARACTDVGVRLHRPQTEQAAAKEQSAGVLQQLRLVNATVVHEAVSLSSALTDAKGSVDGFCADIESAWTSLGLPMGDVSGDGADSSPPSVKDANRRGRLSQGA